MAFTVTLYQFTKRKNSTLQPTQLQGTDLNCELKQPTSYKNPVFLFHVEDGFEWNYLKWDSWYYSITDVVSVRNDIFEVHCALDVLATYKTEIGATSAFVAYDTAANTEIVDSRLSQKTTATFQSNMDRFAYGGLSNSYCVVLGIVGGKAIDMGSDDEGGEGEAKSVRAGATKGNTGLFAMNPADVPLLFDAVADWYADDLQILEPDPKQKKGGWHFPDIDAAIDDIVHAVYVLLQQFLATGKAADCIKSAVWLPCTPEDFFGSWEDIFLGQYNTHIQGRRISIDTWNQRNVTLAIPWQAQDWRRNSPYHHVYVYIEGVGVVEIPPNEIMGDQSLLFTAEMSPTGAMQYEIYGGGSDNPRIICRMTGQVGGSFMVGSSNINPVTAMAGSMGGVMGVAGAAALGGAAMLGGAGSLIGTMTSLQPVPHSVGSGGGFMTNHTVKVITVFHDTNVAPASVSGAIGTPTMAVKQISSCSGFVQTKEASVNASCYEDVRTEINQLMDGGFFYE